MRHVILNNNVQVARSEPDVAWTTRDDADVRDEVEYEDLDVDVDANSDVDASSDAKASSDVDVTLCLRVAEVLLSKSCSSL